MNLEEPSLVLFCCYVSPGAEWGKDTQYPNERDRREREDPSLVLFCCFIVYCAGWWKNTQYSNERDRREREFTSCGVGCTDAVPSLTRLR